MKNCEHCGIICDSANYSSHHGERCFSFTGIKNKISKHKPSQIILCEVCGKTIDASNFGRHGPGPNCKRKSKSEVLQPGTF
jgi:hypothetical protein